MKMQYNYSVSCDCRDANHKAVRNINMNFEPSSNEELMENLNIWLTAIKVPLEVVVKQ
jgi:hypothetical protein